MEGTAVGNARACGDRWDISLPGQQLLSLALSQTALFSTQSTQGNRQSTLLLKTGCYTRRRVCLNEHTLKCEAYLGKDFLLLSGINLQVCLDRETCISDLNSVQAN